MILFGCEVHSLFGKIGKKHPENQTDLTWTGQKLPNPERVVFDSTGQCRLPHREPKLSLDMSDRCTCKHTKRKEVVDGDSVLTGGAALEPHNYMACEEKQ